MKKNGFKQKELAEKIGVKFPCLKSYVQKKAMPKIDVMIKIRNLLGKTIDEILTTEIQF